jgi:NAD(P)H-hydrate epimerase
MEFITDTGIVVPAITTEQMIEVDRLAIEEFGPNLFQMMENAGRNLALQAISGLGDAWQTAKIVVLAGTGGNGGGGICAARHLANRGGDVSLCLSAVDRLREVPQWQYQVYQAAGGKTISLTALQAFDDPVDLVIDAIIGYSLRAAPHGIALELIQWANAVAAPILSLDTPSGVDSTTGQTLGTAIQPQWTMTLALPKTGLLPEKTGQLMLADLGIPVAVYQHPNLNLAYQSPFDHRYRVPLTVKEGD